MTTVQVSNLSLQEMKQGIILAICKHCKEQAKFKPVEAPPRPVPFWNLSTEQTEVLWKDRHPDEYECETCGIHTIFPSLASSQIAWFHRKENRKGRGWLPSAKQEGET